MCHWLLIVYTLGVVAGMALEVSSERDEPEYDPLSILASGFCWPLFICVFVVEAIDWLLKETE
jgi:hypothetical protein